MAYEVVIPRLGLTMEEGRVLEWYKSDGEVIEPGEPLFSVETDKVVLYGKFSWIRVLVNAINPHLRLLNPKQIVFNTRSVIR